MNDSVFMRRMLFGLSAWGMMALTSSAQLLPLPFMTDDPERAEVYAAEPVGEPRFKIGLETWISSGEGDWEISFIEADPSYGDIAGRSKLEWKNLDSTIFRAVAEARVTPWLRINAAYGLGDIDSGRNTDTDWIGLADGPEFLLFQSVADTRGDMSLFNIDFLFRLNELLSMNGEIGYWDLVLGYQYYEDRLRDRNGVQMVDFGDDVRIPFDGLDSTYDFEWSAFRFGIRGAYPVIDRLTAKISALLFFGMDYQGEGYWNLRDDFQGDSPNFVHETDKGYGTEVRLSMQYDLTANIYAEVGYWALNLRGRDGTDITHFVDGTHGVAELDSVHTVRDGFFIGMGASF